MFYNDDEFISDAIARYYRDNGLPSDGGFGDKWARYKFGWIEAIAFPNFEHRKEALRRHDVHHIINNLDTSPTGEGLIAAWELGSGCGKYWISWFMESQALWWGILLAPRKTLSLFSLGRRSKNYFRTQMEPDLNHRRIGEIRSRMLPNSNPKLTIYDLIRFGMVSFLGLVSMLIFIPIATSFTLFGFIIGANHRQ